MFGFLAELLISSIVDFEGSRGMEHAWPASTYHLFPIRVHGSTQVLMPSRKHMRRSGLALESWLEIDLGSRVVHQMHA